MRRVFLFVEVALCLAVSALLNPAIAAGGTAAALLSASLLAIDVS
jgi:hypothetical protein